jgi:predicted amidophosphoribosyltransferase
MTIRGNVVVVRDSLIDRLVSLVVPPLCLCCREPELSGLVVCDRCRARLVPLRDPRCGRCGAPVVASVPRCPECRGRHLAFTTAWAPFAYETTARTLVGALKQRGATRGAAFMGAEIASRAPPSLVGGTLVPVPAHPGRRRRTGMNQAACLAASIGRRVGLPVAALLGRVTGAQQVGLARGERIANARSSVTAPRRPVGGRLVLVDDVYTTGATLDACARALLEAGADEVVAITFARALRYRGQGGIA